MGNGFLLRAGRTPRLWRSPALGTRSLWLHGESWGPSGRECPAWAENLSLHHPHPPTPHRQQGSSCRHHEHLLEVTVTIKPLIPNLPPPPPYASCSSSSHRDRFGGH